MLGKTKFKKKENTILILNNYKTSYTVICLFINLLLYIKI